MGATNSMRTDPVDNKDGSKGAWPVRPFLAEGKVCFVGEAVAMVVAETLRQARDAAELVELEVEELPVSVGIEPGRAGDPPGSARQSRLRLGDGTAGRSRRRLRRRRIVSGDGVDHNRVIVNALEPRAAYAEWDGSRLHLCVNGQGVWVQKAELTRASASRRTVRVTNPDVGGGFGMKSMTYPEYFAIWPPRGSWARGALDSDRTEAMLSDNGGRDLVSHAEFGFDADHRLLAYRVRSSRTLGPTTRSYAQHIQSELFAKVLTGVYDFQLAALAAGASTPTPRRSTPIAARVAPRRSIPSSGPWTTPRVSGHRWLTCGGRTSSARLPL